MPVLNRDELFYRGEIWRFLHNRSYSSYVKTDYNSKTISSGIILAGETLNRWYKKEAAFYLPVRVATFAAEYKFTYSKATVREARRRWGSCSVRGSISLNSKLILAPVWVSDAIIMHELCHTVHHNHGKMFLDMLRSIYPRWEEGKKWLKDHYAFIEKIWLSGQERDNLLNNG